MNEMDRPVGEVVADSVTHGVAALFAIAGMCVLIVVAASKGESLKIVSLSVYGASVSLLYIASTLYHGLELTRAGRVLRFLDHTLIFFLIAGTYTPFVLLSIGGRLGWALFGTVWGLAAGGILLKTLVKRRMNVILPVIYVIMGWLIVAALRPLIANIGTGGFLWLAGGGAAYTLGLIFFGWERLPYHHAVWHLFVIAGSVMHYFAILFYVA